MFFKASSCNNAASVISAIQHRKKDSSTYSYDCMYQYLIYDVENHT